jgi:membrane protein
MTFLHFFKILIRYAISKDVGRHAQSLSFSTVLTIVPMTTIFFGVLAASNWTNVAKSNLQVILENNLFPNAISNTFTSYINIFSNQASGIKTIGLIFFIVSICFLFMDMENSFSAIVDCKTNKKWYSRILSLFLLFVAPLLIFLLFGFSEWLTSMSLNSIKNLIYTLTNYTIIIKCATISFTWAWFFFLYKVLPHKKISLKSLCVGSLLATCAFNLSQVLFGFYLDTFSTYQIIYGVFSAIPIFLLWIYLNWQITLYGLLISYLLDQYTKIRIAKEKSEEDKDITITHLL